MRAMQPLTVRQRVDLDPRRLGQLTDLERDAYRAGRAERAWLKAACFVAGLISGFGLCELLSGQVLLG